MYSAAGYGDYSLGHFLRERPDVVSRLGVALDLDRDDAEIALQLAPSVGRYKRRAAIEHASERRERALRAALHLTASARHRPDRVELDVDILLGDLLADAKRYISFELGAARVPVHRHVLVKARRELHGFLDLAAFVDKQGLHLRWRAGYGGLNLRPQVEERGADVLHVDLRPAARVRRVRRPAPVLLGEVLAELGFFF